MPVLVTGAAGFIGYHVALALLERGEEVLGVDNLDPYYDVALKRARLARLAAHRGFAFRELDIADPRLLVAASEAHAPIGRVVHLAAQAGVRYSLTAPFAYAQANLLGHLSVLELCRRLPRLDHLVYASSSSVYGTSRRLPFTTDDRADTPVSLYAATKRADELMSHCYSTLYGIPATGLRYFTVYGPWGRPDMAAYKFTRAIMAGEPIRVFNRGKMKRDFTFVDDAVRATLAVLDRPPQPPPGGGAPHRVYNVANGRAEALLRFIRLIEEALGRQATLDLAPMEPGDVAETWADAGPLERDFGVRAETPIEEGIPRFVAWYRTYHKK